MFRSSAVLGRGLAVALLAAVIVGPLGVAGLAHPADDPLCRPQRAGADHQGAASASTILVATAADDQHCPTCHLLRTVRWSVTPGPGPCCAQQPCGTAVVPSREVLTGNARLTLPGRSPPPRPTGSAA